MCQCDDYSGASLHPAFLLNGLVLVYTVWDFISHPYTLLLFCLMHQFTDISLHYGIKKKALHHNCLFFFNWRPM